MYICTVSFLKLLKMKKHIAIIGSGFAGLAAASVIAKAGHSVTVFEKNEQVGGRARVLKTNGYVFDMGPSWYWMPDVFERFFSLFNKNISDYYILKKLDPGFTMYFKGHEQMNVPASLDKIFELFNKEEPDGAEKLKRFLKEAEVKYNVAFKQFIYNPCNSILEFVNFETLKYLPRLDIFNSFESHVAKYFESQKIRQLMKFPILFLGGSPKNIPALYSLMNYAALKFGTWYPEGGFSKITDAMLNLAKELKVEFKLNESVIGINIEEKKVKTLLTTKAEYIFDAVIASSDYEHTEKLLSVEFRNYDENYWDKKVMSPSCLIFYIGLTKKLPGLDHHNLFFDEDFDEHVEEIYSKPKWPNKPLYYVCCPSKTDITVAPEGHENIFILMPLASGLSDTEALRQQYYNLLLERLESRLKIDIRSSIDYTKSYCINNFKEDYNSFKGNAYGLANTLKQTAFLKPTMRNKKIKNLFYCGQLTVPGPGVPPSLISGEIAANETLNFLKTHHEI